MTYRSKTRIDPRIALRRRKSKDWIRWWIYQDTAFERLNPEE